MPIAIVTPIGKAHELRGRALLGRFCASYGSAFVATPPDRTALVDGVAVRGDAIVAVLEAKVRSGYSLYDMRRMGATLILSKSKLDALAMAAKAMAVPAMLVAEFSDGHCWYWKVALPDGSPAIRWNVRRSVTRADSIGGPDVERENGFLSLDEGVCWASPDEGTVAL